MTSCELRCWGRRLHLWLLCMPGAAAATVQLLPLAAAAPASNLPQPLHGNTAAACPLLGTGMCATCR